MVSDNILFYYYAFFFGLLCFLSYIKRNLSYYFMFSKLLQRGHFQLSIHVWFSRICEKLRKFWSKEVVIISLVLHSALQGITDIRLPAAGVAQTNVPLSTLHLKGRTKTSLAAGVSVAHQAKGRRKRSDKVRGRDFVPCSLRFS